MENNVSLPQALQSIADSEEVYFHVISSRNQAAKEPLKWIFFGLVTTLVLGMILKSMIEQKPTQDNPSNQEYSDSLSVRVFLISIFILTGFALLIKGFKALLLSGGHFLATTGRLVKYYKGKIESYDWKQFSGNMEVNSKQGKIILELRTGEMRIIKDNFGKFIPGTIYISGVKNVLEIEKICRNRIAENRPGPAAVSDVK